MNDFFAGRLAHERQADYFREVQHDELVAQVHGAASEGSAPTSAQAHLAHPARHRLRSLLDRLGPARILARGQRL
jgi:hypothetical protein